MPSEATPWRVFVLIRLHRQREYPASASLRRILPPHLRHRVALSLLFIPKKLSQASLSVAAG